MMSHPFFQLAMSLRPPKPTEEAIDNITDPAALRLRYITRNYPTPKRAERVIPPEDIKQILCLKCPPERGPFISSHSLQQHLASGYHTDEESSIPGSWRANRFSSNKVNDSFNKATTPVQPTTRKYSTRFPCPLCRTPFETVKVLMDHISVSHGEPDNDTRDGEKQRLHSREIGQTLDRVEDNEGVVAPSYRSPEPKHEHDAEIIAENTDKSTIETVQRVSSGSETKTTRSNHSGATPQQTTAHLDGKRHTNVSSPLTHHPFDITTLLHQQDTDDKASREAVLALPGSPTQQFPTTESLESCEHLEQRSHEQQTANQINTPNRHTQQTIKNVFVPQELESLGKQSAHYQQASTEVEVQIHACLWCPPTKEHFKTAKALQQHITSNYHELHEVETEKSVDILRGIVFDGAPVSDDSMEATDMDCITDTCPKYPPDGKQLNSIKTFKEYITSEAHDRQNSFQNIHQQQTINSEIVPRSFHDSAEQLELAVAKFQTYKCLQYPSSGKVFKTETDLKQYTPSQLSENRSGSKTQLSVDILFDFESEPCIAGDDVYTGQRSLPDGKRFKPIKALQHHVLSTQQRGSSYSEDLLELLEEYVEPCMAMETKQELPTLTIGGETKMFSSPQVPPDGNQSKSFKSLEQYVGPKSPSRGEISLLDLQDDEVVLWMPEISVKTTIQPPALKSGQLMYTCSLCPLPPIGKLFKTPWSLEQHLAMFNHGGTQPKKVQQVTPEEPVKPTVQLYTCPMCPSEGKKFKTLKSLEQHTVMTLHDPSNTNQHIKPGLKQPSTALLAGECENPNPVKIVEHALPAMDVEEWSYICPLCPPGAPQFQTLQAAQQHIATETHQWGSTVYNPAMNHSAATLGCAADRNNKTMGATRQPLESFGVICPRIASESEAETALKITQSLIGTTKITFSDEMLKGIDSSRRETQVLVISPTRNLALYVADFLAARCEHLGITTYATVGGNPLHVDLKTLREGPHIVSGTPMRVFDTVNRRWLRTGVVKLLVLNWEEILLGRLMREQMLQVMECLGERIPVARAAVQEVERVD